MLWVMIISLGFLGYAYAGYPLLIWGLSRIRCRSVKKDRFAAGVSVLIAAHNEEENLPRKLENLLELAKTEPIREIWVGLDGCTDGTGEKIKGQRAEGRGQRTDRQPAPCTLHPESIIHVLEFEQRCGKAAVLNDLMGRATQPVFVMMDARQRVEPGAMTWLLENFADEQVGVVSGALVYESAAGGVQKGAESYWGYEKFIRECESRFWAVPGATGALYAIRKELCRKIPENTLVDDVLIPMRAGLEGFRCLFEPAARVFDLPTTDFRRENLRKRRTLAGIWQIGRLEPKIFSIFANPIWFQWISHKFLRLLTPFFLLAAVGSVGLMACWNDGMMGRAGIIFWGMIGLLGFSGLAYVAGRRVQSRLLGLLGAFWGVNWALLLAAWDAGTGRYEPKWKK